MINSLTITLRFSHIAPATGVIAQLNIGLFSPFLCRLKWQQQHLVLYPQLLTQDQMVEISTPAQTAVPLFMETRIHDCKALLRSQGPQPTRLLVSLLVLSSTSLHHLHHLSSNTSGLCPSPITLLLASQA